MGLASTGTGAHCVWRSETPHRVGYTWSLTGVWFCRRRLETDTALAQSNTVLNTVSTDTSPSRRLSWVTLSPRAIFLRPLTEKCDQHLPRGGCSRGRTCDLLTERRFYLCHMFYGITQDGSMHRFGVRFYSYVFVLRFKKRVEQECLGVFTGTSKNQPRKQG